MNEISSSHETQNQLLNSSSSDRRNIAYQHPFATDSLAPASIVDNEIKQQTDAVNHKNNPGLFERMTSSLSSLWGYIFGDKINNEQVSQRVNSDVAITKQETKARQHFNKEVAEMYERILQINDQFGELLKDPSQNREALLLKVLITAVKNEIKIQQNQGGFQLHKLEDYKKETHALNNNQKKIEEELATLTKQSDFAGKIDKAMTVVAAVVAFAAIGKLPGDFHKYIPSFTTMTTLAKGGTTLLQGYTKGESEEKTKEAYLLNAEKELAKAGVDESGEKLHRTMQEISSIWSILKEIAELEKNTASEINNR